jgi:hypothetical protein
MKIVTNASGDVVEKLRMKTIGGFIAEGTRSSYTVPAGQDHNDQSIVVVHESWYGPGTQNLWSDQSDQNCATLTISSAQIIGQATHSWSTPSPFAAAGCRLRVSSRFPYRRTLLATDSHSAPVGRQQLCISIRELTWLI